MFPDLMFHLTTRKILSKKTKISKILHRPKHFINALDSDEFFIAFAFTSFFNIFYMKPIKRSHNLRRCVCVTQNCWKLFFKSYLKISKELLFYYNLKQFIYFRSERGRICFVSRFLRFLRFIAFG